MNQENIISAPNFIPEQKNISGLNKIIKWCIYIFIFLLPLWFLPFTGDVLEFNKQVLMIVVLTIAFIAWLGKLLTQGKIRWYRGLIIIFFFVFVLVYALATIFSLRPHDSLMGFDTNLSRVLVNVIYFFVLFLLLVSYEAEKKAGKNIEILKFLTVFSASSVIVAIIGLLQILGKFIFPWDFTKINSFNTVGTMTSLGIFLAVVLPLALSLLFSVRLSARGGPALGWKIILIALVCLSFITILLLNFRTVWIVTAISMLMVAGFWLAKLHSFQSQNFGWLAIPVAILAVCLIFLFFRPSFFDLQLPLEIELTQKGGFDVVKEVIQRNPILGTGPGTFVYNYSLYKPEAINQTIFWNVRFSNAPSEILSLLSEIGILGTLAFLALIVVFLLKTVKDLINEREKSGYLSEIKIGLFSGWFALMVSWFLYPQNIALMFVFWLFLGFLTIMSSEERDFKVINLKTSSKLALISSFSFIILMILVIGLLYLGGSKFVAEVKYAKGLDLILNRGELDSGINKIIRATVANPYEDKFYRNLAQLFLSQINQDLNNQTLDSGVRTNRVQAGISNTINSAVRATTLNPKDVSNWLVRGSVYRSLMNLVKEAGAWAINSYEEALRIEPTNPFIYVETARTYVTEADLLTSQTKDEATEKQINEYLDKALNAYTDAIKIKSDYSVAHFEIALVYDRQGKTDEAITKMENNLALAPRDTGILFQLGVLYYKDSRFDKAKLAFSRAVDLDENFSNARYFLGLLFDREGNKEAAIEQFEKIAELNPDNSLVKEILANLKAGKPALGSAKLGPPEQPEEIPIEERQPEELRPGLPESK